VTRPLSGGPVSVPGASVPPVTESAGHDAVALSDDQLPGAEEALDLYDSVGWVAYTRHPDVLARALAGSTTVVTARRGGRLVGLARAISDGATICYLQDILVRPEEHRTGVGRALVERVLDRHADVRQRVLVTDAEPGQRAFYESLGFTELHEVGSGDGEDGLRGFISWAQG